MATDVLGIGLAGKSLSDLERRILRENTPYAVVLFGRNIQSADQLRELVREVKSIAKRPPLFMIDEEGGRVDRLRNLIPGLPSAEAFGEGERSEEMSAWLGRVIGMALRFFDIEIDLAPVVDVRGEVPPKGLERRTFGRDPETVVELAGAFMRGLHSGGVAACVKHFPGIGVGEGNPHYGATVIDVPLSDLLACDLVPFQRLGDEAGAIMIGHGTYPQLDDPDVPATLSRKLTTDLLRGRLGFKGAALSDDMEMHAVSDRGTFEEISEQALLAGNDCILFCSHIERIPDLQRYLRARVNEDATFRARFDEAVARLETYRAHCERIRETVPPVGSFDALLGEVERFCDAFQETRPAVSGVAPEIDRRENDRTPLKGRTGREEWT